MHPELTLSLAGHQFVLSSIAFFYWLAWVVGLLLAAIVAWRRRLPWFWSLFVYAFTIVAGIVGARLLHVADNWGYYALHWGRLKALDFDSFALYGGLILAAVVGAWVARSFRLRAWRLADSAVPALALGIASCALATSSTDPISGPPPRSRGESPTPSGAKPGRRSQLSGALG